ncbi:phage tail protein [Xenorhabdus bovienii]|uniref:phage tail protein n=2 Tax=Xenorhabdus bovienii TaxID=40576 RepID=UPI0023B2DAA8|nr:phage tail protein [Xenorhabdus bovienii]MDE9499301.1 phage tail protein [Xenorhabdus bovienii]
MAKNEFLPFGIAAGASVLTNEEYDKLAARTNGFSSGVAKSQELNKVWRQASVIANVVAQFIAETNNQDVLDNGNTEALRAGLLNALRATVGSNIPVASQTTAGIAKLSNATNSEAENVAATPKAVKQAADMANQARTEAGNANATANTANQNAGNAITNANTANQNASNANNNANSRLEKNQNGADIPDPKRFVENLGLAETKKQAENALTKSMNGADIPNKLAFLNVIGAQPKGDYATNESVGNKLRPKVNIEPDVLDGSKLISEQLMNGFGVAIRGSAPIPADAPAVDGAIKVVQIGNNAWPTLLAFSAYENKMFIRTRKERSGWNDWLDITDYVTNSSVIYETGTSTTQVMSQKAVTDRLVGINQSWRNVTRERNFGSTYTNRSKKALAFVVSASSNGDGCAVGASVNGIEAPGTFNYRENAVSSSSLMIVPPGASYSARISAGKGTLINWLELS